PGHGLSHSCDGTGHRTRLERTGPGRRLHIGGTRPNGTWLFRPLGLPTSRPCAIERIGEIVTCLQRKSDNFATIRPQAAGAVDGLLHCCDGTWHRTWPLEPGVEVA